MSIATDYFRSGKHQRYDRYYCFRWIITEFAKRRGLYCSPSVLMDYNNEYEINVTFHKESENEVSVILLHKVLGGRYLDLIFYFEIQNQRNDIYFKDSKLVKYPSEAKTCFKIPKRPTSKSLYDGKEIHFNANLEIRGSLIVLKDQEIKENITSLCCKKENVSQLQDDFYAMLQNKQFCDVSLENNNDVIPTHKFVLCARSPVLRDIIQNDVEGSKNLTLKFDDFDKPVMEAFLTYLYTGILKDCTFETITALYSAAHKYEVPSLRDICSGILTSSLSDSSVIAVLQVADMHNDPNLKDITTEFIFKNFSSVEKTIEWKQLLDSHPHLASYVLKHISTKMLNNYKNG